MRTYKSGSKPIAGSQEEYGGNSYWHGQAGHREIVAELEQSRMMDEDKTTVRLMEEINKDIQKLAEESHSLK